MLTERLYLRFLKISLILFIVTLPLANRDIFSVVLSRIFPVRVVLVSIITFTSFYLLNQVFTTASKRVWFSERINILRNDFVFKLLFSLLIVRIVSLKNSLNLTASFSLLLFFLSVIALYLILRFLFEKEVSLLRLLFKIHLGMVSLVVLYGILQLVLAFFGMRLPGVLVGSTFVRIPATFYDANHLPAYLLTAFPTLLVFYFNSKKESSKLFVMILMAFYALVTLFSFSRSGFLSFGLVIVTFTIFFLKRRYWKKFLVLFSIVAFSAMIIFLSSRTQLSIFKRLTSVFDLSDKSTVAHGLLLYSGIDLLKKSPLIGLGYGSFSEHFRASSLGKQHAFFDTATDVRIPAHSIWLEVLVETGLLGFALYFWLMITILERGWSAFKALKSKGHQLEQLALLLSLVGLLTSGLFYSYNLEFFWFFLFYFYFRSLQILGSAKSLPAQEVKTNGVLEEVVDWRRILAGVCVLTVATSLIFSNLSLKPIRPGLEGLYATVGKDLRREWGYNAPSWWLPKYRDSVVAQAPALFWLNAFWTYLFDFGESIPRFFPAFFASLTCLGVFILARKNDSISTAFLAAILLLVAPFFLNVSGLGYIYSAVAFFSLLTVYLSRLVLSDKKYFTLPLLVFSLAIYSLTSYVGSILACLWLAVKIVKSESGQFLKGVYLAAVLFSQTPLFLWVLCLIRSQNLKAKDFLPTFQEFVIVVYFAILPILILAMTRVAKSRPRTVYLISIFILISFYFSGRISSREGLTQLVKVRMDLSRDGRIPLYFLGSSSSDVNYYSDVPVGEVSGGELKNRFMVEDPFYAIVDGSTLRSFRQQGIGNFFVRASSENLVLIEKPGKVK